MATLRNKRELATLKTENNEEHTRSNQERYTNVPIPQDYITQVLEEIESRITSQLSREFSKAESRI